MDERPTPDEAKLRASLEDLGERIEAARSGPAAGTGASRSGIWWAIGFFALVAAAIVAGVLAFAGDDEVASDGGPTTAIGAAVSVTAAETTATTEGPTTTADPTTTEVPTTTAVATTTTEAPPTTAAPTTTAAPGTTTTALPPPTTAPSLPSGSDEEAAGSGRQVVVERGDSLWSIAEDEAARRLGRDPTVAEVTSLWVDVLEANADNLVEAGNPDLIYAGQVIVLPGSAPAP